MTQNPEHKRPPVKGLANICDNNDCAAILLNYFQKQYLGWQQTGSKNIRSSLSLNDLGEITYNRFSKNEIYNAVWLLERKSFISVIIEFQGWAGRQELGENIEYTIASHAMDVLKVPQPPRASINYKHKYKAETARVMYHNRRAEEYGLPATLTIEQWIQTLEHFDWKCAYCQEKYALLEHFVPLGYEEGTTWANCVPSCHRCNTIKGPYHPKALPAKLQKTWERILLNV